MLTVRRNTTRQRGLHCLHTQVIRRIAKHSYYLCKQFGQFLHLHLWCKSSAHSVDTSMSQEQDYMHFFMSHWQLVVDTCKQLTVSDIFIRTQSTVIIIMKIELTVIGPLRQSLVVMYISPSWPLNWKMNRTVVMTMLKSTLVLMPVDLHMAASVEIRWVHSFGAALF
jgi:hypothetical protein